MRDAKASQEMEALARAYTAMDGAYQMLGEPEHAVHDRLALDILQKLGRTREAATIESNLGVQAYSEGRWDEAVSWYRLAHEHALESGDLRSAAVAGANLAEVLVSRGALAEAEAMLPEVRRVLRASGRIPFALLAEMQQTRILTARGELHAAVETLSKIFDEALRLGHSGAILEAAIYFAHALAQAGNAAAGLAHLRRGSTACRGRNRLLRRPDRPGRGNLPGCPRTIRRGPFPDRGCAGRGGAAEDAVRAPTRAQNAG